MAAQRHTGTVFTALTTRNRYSGSWVSLAFGRRWSGTQWIELWGDNEGGPVGVGDGAYAVLNDDESTASFTDGFAFNASTALQGF